jgi:hypothetical protein
MNAKKIHIDMKAKRGSETPTDEYQRTAHAKKPAA